MPQLNPEFFISQLFWLVLTFAFLFIFLWRISLPRISSVLEKRASKISNDIKIAKEHQTEAAEIQNKIDIQLQEARLGSSDLVKAANFNLQNYASKEIEKIEKSLKNKLHEASIIIEKNRLDSLKEINDQIYDITKLTLSKVSKIHVDDKEIKEIVSKIKPTVVN